jgi:tetratricopeptide (TPR) repeat protein
LLREQGNRLLQDGQPGAAELVYTEALKARLSVGAAQWFAHAALSQHAPNSHILLCNRALALSRQGRHGEAERDARKATLLSPLWSKAFARLGTALRDTRRHEEAAVCFERAAFLARAHESDERARGEYEASAEEARLAARSRGRAGRASEDGF